MNLSRCRQLQSRPLHGRWYRAVHPKHLANPLGTAHTPTISSRFNPGTPSDPAFEILYLAEDRTVALFEVQALLGSFYPGAAFVPNPAGGPWTLVEVDVNLQQVVDLVKRVTRVQIQTSVQELTGDWRGYPLRNPTKPRGGAAGSDVPTQRLGRRLERVPKLEGFLTYSARVATHRNLIVFPQITTRQPAPLSRSTIRQLVALNEIDRPIGLGPRTEQGAQGRTARSNPSPSRSGASDADAGLWNGLSALCTDARQHPAALPQAGMARAFDPHGLAN